MEDNTIYIVLGVLAAVYLFITIFNRKRAKDRRSRRFMDNYKRRGNDGKDKGQ